ncbi:MAG: hypothetical protein R2822_23020 [Spirosomataceae bacterium]
MQLSKYFQSKEEVHHLWIVFFRCGVSLFALLHFGSIQADFENLFGLNAFVKPDISLVVSSEYLPTITGISHFLDIKYANLLMIIRYLYPISLLFVFIGLFSRLGAICALFLQLTLTNSIDFFCYGVDAFTTICLFYACIFPIGQFKSVDVLLFRDRKFLISTNQYLWVFQFHLCIIYFFRALRNCSDIIGAMVSLFGKLSIATMLLHRLM